MARTTLPKKYPGSVKERHRRLHAAMKRNRLEEQRLRDDLARTMRDSIDSKQVTATQMAKDLNMSRWRVYQLMGGAEVEA